MATSKRTNNNSTKWYDNPIKKWVAIVSGFLFIAGIGYSFASIQKNLEFKMDKYELKQECNEKLQAEIEKCKVEKQQYENKRVESLEIVVKELEKKYNGK